MAGDKDFCKEVNVKPFAYAISLINGKWKMHILFWLWKKEVLRYSQLKELETSGIIIRTEYPQVPPKVEYSLSAIGQSMMPILQSLCKWGTENIPDDWEMQ